MDYIDKARQSIELTMKHIREDDSSLEQLNFGMLTAIADATIAQAEELKRIADALEQWMSVQGVLPEFFEAVNRAKNELAE